MNMRLHTERYSVCLLYTSISEKAVEGTAESLDTKLNWVTYEEDVYKRQGISRNFIYIVTGFAVTVLTLVFLQLPAVVFAITAVTAGLIFLYKTCEFVKNRYCDRDIRIVLIYKIALFHLLEESCLQEEQHEL